MSSNRYHFVTEWSLDAGIDEVIDILADAEGLPRWWPSVYLDVKRLEDGDADGIGSVFALYTKGWLPYTLRWTLHTTEVQRPVRIAFDAKGDFVGQGLWTLAQEGNMAAIRYEWRVRAEKPLLRRFSFLFKTVFGANHQWAMARGEESLRLELQRRRARSASALMSVPPPPGPTFTSTIRR